MIFHGNRLLADDSHETSYLIFFRKFGKDVSKFVVRCSCDWRFKGLTVYISKQGMVDKLSVFKRYPVVLSLYLKALHFLHIQEP